MKILLISTPLPSDTSAGDLLLFRHFSQLPGLSLTIAGDATSIPLAQKLVLLRLHPLMSRFIHSRLSAFAHDFLQCMQPIASLTELRSVARSGDFDLVVTVAEGYHWKIAVKIAQEFRLPLVTFFHDWWPSMCFVHERMRPRVERAFLQLARKSSVALCVSEGMTKALGPDVHSELIYPIPANTQASPALTRANGSPLQIIYTGALWHPYAQMLERFIEAIAGGNNLRLKLFGRDPGQNGAYIYNLPDNVSYEGFISSTSLPAEFAAAHALLVVISFDPAEKKWSETSFPSKLVEYCQQGRPILIWGPEYSTAIQWAQQTGAALAVTSPDAQAAVSAFQELANDPALGGRIVERALAVAATDFSPALIQQRFEAALECAATKPR